VGTSSPADGAWNLIFFEEEELRPKVEGEKVWVRGVMGLHAVHFEQRLLRKKQARPY
jgi:hypothetical protein